MVTIALYLWLIFFAIMGFSMNPAWLNVLVIVLSVAAGVHDGIKKNKKEQEKRRRREEMRRRKLDDNFDPVFWLSFIVYKEEIYARNHFQKEPDNMRGFDPASEDDMDDNGMSRYMENNDEEGWD